MARGKSGQTKDRKEVVIAFRVTAAIKDAAEKKAQAEGRSLANYISWLVTKDLGDNGRKK